MCYSLKNSIREDVYGIYVCITGADPVKKRGALYTPIPRHPGIVAHVYKNYTCLCGKVNGKESPRICHCITYFLGGGGGGRSVRVGLESSSAGGVALGDGRIVR